MSYILGSQHSEPQAYLHFLVISPRDTFGVSRSHLPTGHLRGQFLPAHHDRGSLPEGSVDIAGAHLSAHIRHTCWGPELECMPGMCLRLSGAKQSLLTRYCPQPLMNGRAHPAKWVPIHIGSRNRCSFSLVIFVLCKWRRDLNLGCASKLC